LQAAQNSSKERTNLLPALFGASTPYAPSNARTDAHGFAFADKSVDIFQSFEPDDDMTWPSAYLH
jgi:hypothetical protein